MKVLIIAAHVPGIDRVVHGFLQFCGPSLPEVIDQAVSDNARQIVVFPFFISAGSHILTDIPELVDTAAKKYPDIDLSITCHLGKAHGIVDVIQNEVERHLAQGEEKG